MKQVRRIEHLVKSEHCNRLIWRKDTIKMARYDIVGYLDEDTLNNLSMEIYTLLEHDLNKWDWAWLNNECCTMHNVDDYVYENDEEHLNNHIFCNESPSEILKGVMGRYNWYHPFVRVLWYGELITSEDPRDLGLDNYEIANFILEQEDDFEIEKLKRIFEKYEDFVNEEEDE